jgi:hypothetical protein
LDLNTFVPAILSLSLSLIACNALAGNVEKTVFLVVEEDGVVVSNTLLGRFDHLELQAKEKLLEYKADAAVAVVVTNQRFAAYGATTGGWRTRRVRAGERFESMELADYSATVVTNDRILNFYGRTGVWSETKR